ncbi:sodium-dependent glucose transporter 1-like protein [Leptotrombidium deliense]|uniref:Sodium-dependent glucose transporter 1-like protein n=1 Tax=Leptotrombidium deliense TaxID=299467 RepID=A0A443S5L3_9ACAR|nr:sodium-dependent glucose transporter 1-like protein [Leptotrombidium deliense]
MLFGVNVLLIAVCNCLSPTIHLFWSLILNQAIVGFASGGVDVASNVLLLEMWDVDSNVYLQATHLCYAIGSTLSPLVAAPFLSSNTTTNNATVSGSTVAPPVPNSSRIYIAYQITSATALLSGIITCLFEFTKPYKTPERSLTRKNQKLEINANEGDEEQLVPQGLPKSYYAVFISCAALMLCFYLGVEMNLFNYLPTFIIELKMNISRTTNSFMNAAFSGVYTGFRFISIFVARKVKPVVMLYMSLSTLLFAHIFILTFGHDSEAMLWITVVIAGAGCSWVYPTFYAFVEERIDVTNSIGALFMFSSSVITTVTPLIVGNTIEKMPLMFVYVNVASLLFVVAFFISMHTTDRWKKSILQKSHTI